MDYVYSTLHWLHVHACILKDYMYMHVLRWASYMYMHMYLGLTIHNARVPSQQVQSTNGHLYNSCKHSYLRTKKLYYCPSIS